MQDLRIVDQWFDPMILALIQHHFNSSVCAETGYEPFTMMMGSADALYYKLQPEIEKAASSIDLVRRLDENIKLIREISSQHQAERKLVVYNDSSPCIRYYITNYLVIIILYIYIYLSVSESLIDSQQSRSN